MYQVQTCVSPRKVFACKNDDAINNSPLIWIPEAVTIPREVGDCAPGLKNVRFSPWCTACPGTVLVDACARCAEVYRIQLDKAFD
ncbi:uncharacterized protein YALI1_D22208g [Yarrowia lipolytica]|uniref:Uncharacterized protein n=1 Tax=Yarrowia lipolytica TaxID=4952 RepID=A0A1D8NF22_YARLL|nr:hypothetical protein YALI1_D22208g [Yarrowia lipolytica]